MSHLSTGTSHWHAQSCCDGTSQRGLGASGEVHHSAVQKHVGVEDGLVADVEPGHREDAARERLVEAPRDGGGVEEEPRDARAVGVAGHGDAVDAGRAHRARVQQPAAREAGRAVEAARREARVLGDGQEEPLVPDDGQPEPCLLYTSPSPRD